MSINPLYVPLFTIEEVILDKTTGLPLAAGVVKFYRDTQRLTPKVVYKITGTAPNYTFIAVGSQLTLGVNGAFVDGSGNNFVPYAYPYDAEGELDLYYITVESSTAVPQFTREAVPHINSGDIPPEQRSNTDNELCNPNFVEVNLGEGVTTVNVTGSNTVTAVAPGWDIISSGTGTIELERLEPIALNVPTNPPYALRISASAGLGSSIVLRQRLNNTPSIMRNGFCSATFTAAVLSGGSTFISLTYAPSTGVVTDVIPSTSISTDGAYHSIFGNVAIPDQVNDPASTGYVDINVTIPTSRNVAITSLQIVGVSDSIDIPYDEQTADRQKDQLFHYYEDATVHQPKSDILTGWKFALNPWQFRNPASSNVANNTYTADQTIIIQQAYVDSATANNVAVGQGGFADNYSFQISAVTATNKTMVLQYVSPTDIAPYWGKKLSVRVKGNLVTTNDTTLSFKLRLMYKAGLPGVLSQTVPVSAWANTDNALPTVSGDGWTYLTALNDPTYSLTDTIQAFDFNSFDLPVSTNANMTLGIAFIMMNNMDETATADLLNIESISLVQNDFAIESMPMTFAESLKRCQYFYEKSYSWNVLAGASDSNGVVDIVTPSVSDGSTTGSYSMPFTINFVSHKRTTPTMTFYTPTGTVGNISVGVNDSTGGVVTAPANKAISQWTLQFSNADRVSYNVNNTNSAIRNSGPSVNNYNSFMRFHYVADARLAT